MGELKSAWEIAQERAQRLGKLSDEEREQQERERCGQIGQALAQRWLDAVEKIDIPAELNKYQGKDRVLIRRAFIEHLVQAIGLGSDQRLEKAKGVTKVVAELEPELQSKVGEIAQLLEEYEKSRSKISQEIEDKRWEILHQLRISGSALDGVNVESDPQWQLAHQKLREEFEPRLQRLKQESICLLTG